MGQSLLQRILGRLSEATPEELAEVAGVLFRQTPPGVQPRAAGPGPVPPGRETAREEGREILLQPQPAPAHGSQDAGAGGPVCIFRRNGKWWEVVWYGGRMFRLRNNLGAQYVNYFVHEPNQPIPPFDLEVKIRPEKGEARVRNSIQAQSDAQARRQYRGELQRLRAEKAAAQMAGEPEEAARLQEEIKAQESALRACRGPADTGTRARDNVRKAIAVVLAHLREGGPEEKAFAAHLRAHLSIGYECLYSLPEGRIWG